MKKDKIIRCITSDGAVVASAIDSSNIVRVAHSLHKTSSVATAALGRLLSATSMMGAMLKDKDGIVNTRIAGDGPLGVVISVSDSNGNVRGYVENSNCPTEYYDNGKINVAKAVGKDGVLNVMRSFGTNEPYIGKVKLVSGEIAEDITHYYATSEQIPTICALGVLIDKETGVPLVSGGLLVQLLPGADDNTIEKLENNLKSLEPITVMLSKEMSTLEMCKLILKDFEVEVLDEYPVKYVCSCTREKLLALIEDLGQEEIKSMIEEDGGASANCHFCNKKYIFSKEDLENLIK